jgi:hypothetical protein
LPINDGFVAAAGPATLPHGERESFRERYCAHFGITSERFEDHVLDRCLFAPARWLRPTLEAVWAATFQRDRSFVTSFGEAQSERDLRNAVEDFQDAQEYAHWIRRHLKIRISSRRFQSLAREIPPSRSGLECRG